MTDALTRQIAEARPYTGADDGWAGTPAGAAALSAVLNTSRPAPRRGLRIVAIGVGGAMALAGGTAAAITITDKPPTDAYMVLCDQSASADADGAGVRLSTGTPEAAAEACAEHWSAMFPGTARPDRFAVCIYPASADQAGGGQLAVPAKLGTTDADVCGSLGTVPAA